MNIHDYQAIQDYINEHAGISINSDGVLSHSGYMVGIVPFASIRIPRELFTLQHIADFIADGADYLQSGLFFGAWLDCDDAAQNQYYVLDWSLNTIDYDAAIVLARVFNQDAIYHIDADKNIYIR